MHSSRGALEASLGGMIFVLYCNRANRLPGSIEFYANYFCAGFLKLLVTVRVTCYFQGCAGAFLTMATYKMMHFAILAHFTMNLGS